MKRVTAIFSHTNLGCTFFGTPCSMRDDMLAKRGKLIGKIHALLQEFHYADPALLMQILCIHVTAFYGSSLWDLYSKEVIKIFSSWNVTVRNVFKLPRTTHRYFIEPVSGQTHPGEVFGDSLDLLQRECPVLSKH